MKTFQSTLPLKKSDFDQGPSSMATVQTNLLLLPKLQAPFKGPMKRQSQETPLEATPMKKRVVAAMNLSFKKIPESYVHVKTEHMEEEPLGFSSNTGYQQVPRLRDGTEGALDLSPGLRHTLAQFTLSSQCSLGGPAAFFGHHGQDIRAPPQPPCGAVGVPLLVPPDSSTDLALCYLEGEPISCFSVGGERRLCLPQMLNTVLRDFSLQQINSVCDQLYVYCSRCDAPQLHMLKALGVLPPSAPSCGLITLTDAQRLCNTLLHPGDAATPGPPKGHRGGGEEEKDEDDAGGFWVEHQCLGKCQGLFVPRLFTSPDAPCVRCSQCHLLFSPERFVMHSHRQPDKRTCHWGFESARWACYLQLGCRYLGTANEPKLKQLLEKMKEKFHKHQLERTQCNDFRRRFPTAEGEGRDQAQQCSLSCGNIRTKPKSKRLDWEAGQTKGGLDLCALTERLCESTLDGKAVSSPAFVFDHCLYPDVKDDPSHLDITWQSWYLYMHDNLIGPSMSLSPGCGLGTGAGALTVEMLGAMLKQDSSHGNNRLSKDQDGTDRKTPTANELKTSRSAVQSQHEGPDARQPQRVSIETHVRKNSGALSVEENKDSMVMEVLQMYNAQHERLQSTLQKQRQLEKELDSLRGGEADQRNLRGEMEAVQTEHAQRLGEGQQEQRKLKSRLEQLRQQSCRCKGASAELHQEAHYATQLSELRLRLDRAEEDREELQEELCREKEAREKLERTISEFKQQMKESTPPGSVARPIPTPPGQLLP